MGTPHMLNEIELLSFYREHLEKQLLPFWQRSSDERHGGVYNCYNNTGDKLLSTDKYTWSQGRFLWLWARVARLCRRGLLSGDAGEYLRQGAKTAEFLEKHAFLDNGNCCYVLSESGERREMTPGGGYDTSVFADCFVALGFMEYAVAAGSRPHLERAYDMYGRIRVRIAEPYVPTWPIDFPPGFRAHSVPMIMLNLAQELASALEIFGDARHKAVRKQAAGYAEEILTTFRDAGCVIHEVIPTEDEGLADTLLARHHNPGHAIESMWFVLTEAVKQRRDDWIAIACAVAKRSFQLGWDEESGGLLRFVDRIAGGQPQGRLIGGTLENAIVDTWDMKIWWPHSETLYTSLLAWFLTGDREMLDIYEQTESYVFRTFPNPDRAIGEWIQIRDRGGVPISKLAGLPVKDPYHIMRNMLLLVELLDDHAGRS